MANTISFSFSQGRIIIKKLESGSIKIVYALNCVFVLCVEMNDSGEFNLLSPVESGIEVDTTSKKLTITTPVGISIKLTKRSIEDLFTTQEAIDVVWKDAVLQYQYWGKEPYSKILDREVQNENYSK